MRTITAISCAIIRRISSCFSGARAAKDSQGLPGRVAGKQGRKSGQRDNGKGLRHAVSCGRSRCAARSLGHTGCGPGTGGHRAKDCQGMPR